MRKDFIFIIALLYLVTLSGCFVRSNAQTDAEMSMFQHDATQEYENLQLENPIQENPVTTTPTPTTGEFEPLKNTLAGQAKAIKSLPIGKLKIPVLMYHYVRPFTSKMKEIDRGLSVKPEQLDEEMKYITEHGFTTITLDEMMSALEGKTNLPSKPIMLTFDDGYSDLYTYGFPIFKKYNVKVVSFLIAGSIKPPIYLTKEQIVEMHDSGLVDFQSHTVNHPKLGKIYKANITKELVDSKKFIEDLLGKKVEYLCYPYGSYSNIVIAAAKEAGYKMAFTVNPSYIHDASKPFLQDRIRTNYKFGAKEFSRLIEVF